LRSICGRVEVGVRDFGGRRRKGRAGLDWTRGLAWRRLRKDGLRRMAGEVWGVVGVLKGMKVVVRVFCRDS
jgi:hypothetical protein